MAKTEIIVGEVGGGSSELYEMFRAAGSSGSFSVSITGKAKEVYLIDERGYGYSNVNPNTRQILTSSIYLSSTTWGEINTEYSSASISCGNNSITFNGFNGSYKYFIFYTLE